MKMRRYLFGVACSMLVAGAALAVLNAQAPQAPAGRGGVAGRGAAPVGGAAAPAESPIPPVNITEKDVAAGFANPQRWLSVSGDYTGQRFSPLKQITPANAHQLAAQWTFQTGVSGKFETTPIVVDGILYVSGILNHAWAIDGKTGKQIWHYQRQLPPANEMKICCGTVNRGLAVHGDKVFMTTLDAHLVALEMRTGKVAWDVPISDYKLGHAATQAPLLIKDKLIVGVAGGEFAIRGFLDAYNVNTGERVWRFWTVPSPNEPGGDTWEADSWERGGGPTWQTGSYDPELNLVYWGTGNPNPDFFGGSRKGDNLYTGSLIALDADTGKLKWHYQFTPHDEHDWDANQVPVLADINFGGRQRKVVMLANRNGFFYVLDRATGEFLLGKPYVKTTWATEIGKDGRPIELPNQRPTPQGTNTCPDLYGGTNFMAPSFSPQTGLFYVTARETCMVFRSAAPPAMYKQGDRVMGGTMTFSPGTGALRALDPATGQLKWEIKQNAPGWAGVLTTASDLVFSGDNDGNFFAADAKTGKVLWNYQTGSAIYAPPTTYMIGDRQYVIMPSGTTLTAVALPAAPAR
jgi:alcohol dehydrogenase (cytochrome c)